MSYYTKGYHVPMTFHEGSCVSVILADDLANLVLDDDISTGYKAILNGACDTGFSFSLHDDVAHVIMQTFTVYANRLLDAGDSDRAGCLIRFVTGMLTSFTDKTDEDY